MRDNNNENANNANENKNNNNENEKRMEKMKNTKENRIARKAESRFTKRAKKAFSASRYAIDISTADYIREAVAERKGISEAKAEAKAKKNRKIDNASAKNETDIINYGLIREELKAVPAIVHIAKVAISANKVLHSKTGLKSFSRNVVSVLEYINKGKTDGFGGDIVNSLIVTTLEAQYLEAEEAEKHLILMKEAYKIIDNLIEVRNTNGKRKYNVSFESIADRIAEAEEEAEAVDEEEAEAEADDEAEAVKESLCDMKAQASNYAEMENVGKHFEFKWWSTRTNEQRNAIAEWINGKANRNCGLSNGAMWRLKAEAKKHFIG